MKNLELFKINLLFYKENLSILSYKSLSLFVAPFADLKQSNEYFMVPLAPKCPILVKVSHTYFPVSNLPPFLNLTSYRSKMPGTFPKVWCCIRSGGH